MRRREVSAVNKDLKEHIQDFRERSAARATPPTAWELVGGHIKQRGWSRAVFSKYCLLGKGHYYNAKNSEEATPTLPILMAICVGMNLSMTDTEILLAAAGFKLSEAIPLHRAYTYIITNLPGISVIECNIFLAGLGFEALGSTTYFGK